MPSDPNFNRLLTSIKYEEPDRLPLTELWIDPPVKASFFGDVISPEIFDCRSNSYDVTKDIEFWYRAGYDYALLSPKYEFPKSWLHHPTAFLSSLYDYDNYPWPSVHDVDFSAIEYANQHLPQGMKLIVSPQAGIFEEAWMTMGYRNFMVGLFEQPELIQKICDSIGAFLFQLFERLASYDHIGGFWLGDDIAYSEALLLSPGMIRNYFLHWYEKFASIAHEHGKVFLFHSDGHLTPLLDDLIAIKVDAIHPIEPKAMDIVDLKQKTRGKLALFGSIDQDFPLTSGTTDDVKHYVIQRIRDIAPGGGFAIGSSNSIIQYIKLENYLTMINTVMEYGRYPINGKF